MVDLTIAQPTNFLGIVKPTIRQNGITGTANATFRNSFIGNTIKDTNYPVTTTNNRTGFQGENVEFSPISKIGEVISNIAAWNFQTKAQQRAFEQELRLQTLKNEAQANFFNSPVLKWGALAGVLIIGSLFLAGNK